MNKGVLVFDFVKLRFFEKKFQKQLLVKPKLPPTFAKKTSIVNKNNTLNSCLTLFNEF